MRIYKIKYYADEQEADHDDDSSWLPCDDALHAVRAALDNSARNAKRQLLRTRLCENAAGTDLKIVLQRVPHSSP